MTRYEKAIRDIAAERYRQITEEGWTLEHDDDHLEGALAEAAACYALPDEWRQSQGIIFYYDQEPPSHSPVFWPWDYGSWKPTPLDRRKELIKAGALIVAEIERLDRLDPTEDA